MSRKEMKPHIRAVAAVSILLTMFTPGLALAKAPPSKGKAPAAAAKPAPTAKQMEEENAKFATTVDLYFDDFFKLSPTFATELGLHQYDSMMEDFSADGIQKQAAMQRIYRTKFKALDPARLTKLNRQDREILISACEDQLMDLEVIQNWKKDPDIYSSAATNAIFSLIKRDYAPIELRMNSAIARMEKIPGALAQAKKNLILDRVPRVFADINLEQMPGTIDFFQTSVPEAFKGVSQSTLRQAFAKANLDTIDAMKDYQKFVQDLIANGQSKGKFALGADNFARKLKFNQMVDTPLDKLLADGYDELHRQQDQFKALSAKVAPNQPVDEYFVSISKDHPKGNEVIASVTSLLEELKTFCADKNIATIPSKDLCKVEETPSFERALTFASMDCPGAFETKAKDAFYYVTLPEPGWPADRTEEHLRSFCYADLLNTSVHEAYPGHYVQFLWGKQFPSKTRKILSTSSNNEGWAHYCEQMMLDQGLRGDESKLRMVQLHDALLRCCRYIVAIEMHTKNMTLDQAVQFFIKEGYMEKANAEREAKRGTSDPMYLVYTYGKMQILKMRDDYQKQKGDKFNLKEFHDRYLKTGEVPLKIVRAELLNEPLAETPCVGATSK